MQRTTSRLRSAFIWLAALQMLCLVALGGSTTEEYGRGKFERLHFIANCRIGDGYFEQVRMAGLRSLPFDSSHCLETAEEVKQVLDEIVTENGGIAGRVALVVSNVGLPGEEHIARAIREGVYVFLIENSIDIAKYGLDLGQQFVINLRPDNARGGRLIGKELCRIAGGKNQQIALLYGEDPALDLRLDMAIERFKEECPNSRLFIAHTMRGDWSSEQAFTMFRALFLIDSAITTVLCANDAMAEGVIKAADELLNSRMASRLFVSGFDDNDNQKTLRRSRRIFATVNQGTTVANVFLWSTLPKLLDIVETKDIHSTYQLQSILSFQGLTIASDVVLIPADPEGYIQVEIDETYKSTVRAMPEDGDGPTQVTVGLFDVRVEAIDTAEGSFSATFWLQVSWKDPRLAWNPVWFQGNMRRDRGSLWEPYVYLSNMISSKTLSSIGESPLIVANDGLVKTSFKYTAEFGCLMSVEPYPFDMHRCSIDVSVASDSDLVSLEPGAGQQDLVDMPEAFEGNALVDEVEVLVNNNTPNGLMQTTVSFKMEFMRNPSFVTITYVLIAFGLNLVSFGSFWIPPDQGNMDRAGLAITTILANAVLQADARSSLVTTWLDLFFNISTTFQFLTFFMSVVTAHYVFDPDYTSENEIAAEISDRRKEVAGAFTRILTIKSRQMAFGPRSFQEKLLRFADSILGDERDNAPDRIGRRFVVPVFLLIMMILPFVPMDGEYTVPHPQGGTSELLFPVSLSLLLAWVVIVVIKLALESAGVRANDSTASARTSQRNRQQP